MKKLLRNSLIASVVAVAGATTFAAEANAQSAKKRPAKKPPSKVSKAQSFDSPEIEFTATVPKSCTFGTPTSGTLVENTAEAYARLVSSPSVGGQDAIIPLSCNSGATIAVKELQEVATNGMTRQTGQKWVNVLVSDGSSSTRLYEDGSKDTVTKTAAFSETLTVTMDIKYEEPILNPGTYTYRTVITATPQ